MNPARAARVQAQAPHVERWPGMREVTVTTAAEVDAALEEAIEVVTVAAEHYGMGILVTRIGIGRYIVRVHPQVPGGLVRRR
ncbi:hypothetical protein AHiyo6_06040 [Arthrobacter sp. Hiyo6]|nr:hypothetical protein AHiyo6_06040 [Arthrobacter sp. Hiyo6]